MSRNTIICLIFAYCKHNRTLDLVNLLLGYKYAKLKATFQERQMTKIIKNELLKFIFLARYCRKQSFKFIHQIIFDINSM